MVTERFGGIPTAQVSEQTYSDSFEGEDVEPRNVIATLPGETDSRLVVMAPRDSAGGQGVVSSAAATGMLLELAESFGGASHSKTLVFVSSAGATDGARGAREFADNYPEREAIDAAIVISQPGAARLEPPFVIPWSTGSEHGDPAHAHSGHARLRGARRARRPPGLLRGPAPARDSDRPGGARAVDRGEHRRRSDQLVG